MTSILKIHLKDGKVISGRAEFAKGSPSNPMSYDEVADKFRGCAEFAKWPAAKTESVIAVGEISRECIRHQQTCGGIDNLKSAQSSN